MRSLLQSLQDYDRGHLLAIAELWGLELPPGEALAAARFLTGTLADPANLAEISEALPPEAQRALARLQGEGGTLPWADFVQQFGELREMGSGWRDRVKPWRDPVSATEVLYWRGLLARAFAETPMGAREFAYVPHELLGALAPPSGERVPGLGESVPEPETTDLASAAIVDDATTLLAGLRREAAAGQSRPSDDLPALEPFLVYPTALPMLMGLCRELSLVLPGEWTPDPDAVKRFLQAERGHALQELALAWLRTKGWHDFQLLTHLDPGNVDWPTAADLQRQAAVDLIDRVPHEQWWDLDAFVEAVRQQFPSYARPGSRFDTWILRDRRTGAFLRGIEAWESVDGAYLRALIMGPLHWLGAVDLGASEGTDHPRSFRLTRWFDALLREVEPPRVSAPASLATVHADGRIIIPRGATRALRYQIARLSSWEPHRSGEYRYRLLPSAILAAAEEGLLPTHVHRLLLQLSGAEVPPPLLRSLDRLLEAGIEAHVEAKVIVRFEDSSVLDRLLRSKQARRHLKERLGPTSVVVAEAHVEDLLRSAVALGLLIEPGPPGE